MSEAQLAAEARRIYARYALEIVEAFDLCPWARPARIAGRVRELVILGRDTQSVLGSASALLEESAAEGRFDVCLLLCPRLETSRVAFDELVSRLGTQLEKAFARGAVPWALAPFHPDAEADLATPEQLVPFLRRTPDPTIQAVSAKVLERVRAPHAHGTSLVDPARMNDAEVQAALERVPLSAVVAQRNLDRVRSVTARALEERLRDILEDRARSYARVG